MLILRISNNLQYIYKTKDSYLKILNNNMKKNDNTCENDQKA